MCNDILEMFAVLLSMGAFAYGMIIAVCFAMILSKFLQRKGLI